MRITDFKHVSVFILRVNIIKKRHFILVVSKKTARKGTRFRAVKDKTIRRILFVILKTFINILSPIPASLYKSSQRLAVNLQVIVYRNILLSKAYGISTQKTQIEHEISTKIIKNAEFFVTLVIFYVIMGTNLNEAVKNDF